MSPLDSVARLEELGVSLAVEDLCEVEHLHIANSACSPDFAEAVKSLIPRSVRLDGSQMCDADVEALLHFSSLHQLVAHEIAFANTLLVQLTATTRL